MTIHSELYACIYVKEFPSQALLRLRPELQAKPCVVMDGLMPSQYVCSLNSKASQLGISPGMTRVEVDTFRGPIILARSIKAEIAAREIVFKCAGTFSPRVEDKSNETTLLCGIDITGTRSLFGSADRLAGSLLDQVRSLRLSARVTVSTNLHAAFMLARGMMESNCVRIIAQGDEANALASLPVSVLDLTEQHAETLSLWGIHTLGMLAELPEQALIARMGQPGQTLVQLAKGVWPYHFKPNEPGFVLEEQMELDNAVESLEALLFVIAVMIEQLIQRAMARMLALASVTLTLTLEHGEAHTRTVRPALPTTDKQLWIKLIHLDLEAHPTSGAVLTISLHAESGSTNKVQLGLFSPQLPEAARLDVTLARIRSIVGEDNVGRAVLADSHAVESFRLEPFIVPSVDMKKDASRQTRSMTRQLRPAEMVSVTIVNSRLSSFLFRGKNYAIELAYGPWVTGGDWWNTTHWGMEQWDLVARASDGGILCCCMMRDLVLNQWQVAALYD